MWVLIGEREETKTKKKQKKEANNNAHHLPKMETHRKAAMVGAVFGEFRSSVCSGHVHVRGDLELERGPEQQQQHGEPDEGETRKKHADDARQCNAAEGQKSCGGDEEGRAGSNTLVLRCFGDGPKQQQAEVTVPLPWWVKVKALSQTSTNADQGLTSFHALLCPVKDPFSHDQRSPSEHPSESLASSKVRERVCAFVCVCVCMSVRLSVSMSVCLSVSVWSLHPRFSACLKWGKGTCRSLSHFLTFVLVA